MQAQKIIMCRGIQGSGKTTWAKNYVFQNPGTVRVNNDDLRWMLFNEQYNPKNEDILRKLRYKLEEDVLLSGKSLISDNMNLTKKHELRYQTLAEQFKCEFKIQSFMDVPLETCIERDAARLHPVGEKVIRETADRIGYKPRLPVNVNLPHCIICDLDGTLATIVGRSPYNDKDVSADELNPAVFTVIRSYSISPAVYIILMSGRDEGRSRLSTEQWLAKHNVPYDALYMRPAGDTRKDTIVKTELYNTHIKDKYTVDFCLDDRDQIVKLWRGLGLTCFQVAPGDF